MNPQGGGNSVIPAGWQLNADFIAVPAGFPTGVVDGGLLIEVNWSNSGEGTVSNGLYNKWDTQLTIPTVPQEFASSQPYPKDKTSSVRVKVSDKRPGLEADAENSYTIRWHVPFEGWHTIGATKRADRWIMATIDSEPEELNMNANVEYTWYDEEANIMEYAFWESLVVVLGGSGDAVTAWFPQSWGGIAGWGSALMGYLGYALDKSIPKPHTTTSSIHELWLEPASTPSTGRTPEIWSAGLWELTGVHVMVPYNVTPYIRRTVGREWLPG